MQIDFQPSRTTALGMVGAVLTTAGVMGIAWRLDARRRDLYAARLHRMQVDLLLNALTAGDPGTARHSRRVADLAFALAESFGFGRQERATLRVAALLHDMGKIDDQFFDIVHSCTSLSPEERSKIKQHPHESAHILQPLERIHHGITRIVASHHECWDGTGYPHELKGEEIPLGARLISVADVFDALTQPRTYRKPLTIKATLDMIREGAGTRFDPNVVSRLEQPDILQRWTQIALAGREVEARAQNNGVQSTERPAASAKA